MPHYLALPCCLLVLVSACPAGPGTSTGSGTGTDGATSTTGGTMGGSSTGTLPTTTDATTTSQPTTTGATTDTGPATSDTSATTDPTTIATTDATTGVAGCADIVGSMDCPALVAVSGDLTLEQCTLCQGAPCGQEPDCDSQYPCVGDVIVLRGCCSDEQCAGLTPFFGMFIATNNVCVLSDDV
jgi:hypothetical protein